MPKRKHVKKNVVAPCADANQNTRKSIAERERVASAMAKKYEMLRQQYMEEMKRREEEKDVIGKVLNPTYTPDPGRDVAND